MTSGFTAHLFVAIVGAKFIPAGVGCGLRDGRRFCAVDVDIAQVMAVRVIEARASAPKSGTTHMPLHDMLERFGYRLGQSPAIADCAAFSVMSPVHTQRFR